MRVSTDQKRHPLFNLSAIEEDNLLVSGAQEVAGLESESEGRPGNLGYEKLALLQPGNIAPVYFLGADRSVRFPVVCR